MKKSAIIPGKPRQKRCGVDPHLPIVHSIFANLATQILTCRADVGAKAIAFNAA